MTPTIRRASVSDIEALVRGNQRMALETENLRLDRERLRAGVAAVLSDSAKGDYWIAESGGRVVGQLMITREWSDWRNGFIWWIQSVHVAEDMRRRGIYTALYRHTEQRAESDPDCCGLRLYVERANDVAQRTYAGLGMESTNYAVFERDFTRSE